MRLVYLLNMLSSLNKDIIIIIIIIINVLWIVKTCFTASARSNKYLCSSPIRCMVPLVYVFI